MAFRRQISTQHYTDGPCWDQAKRAVGSHVFHTVASGIHVNITQPLHSLLAEAQGSAHANFRGELRPVPMSFRRLLVRRATLFSINDDVVVGRNYVVCATEVENMLSLEVSNCAARGLDMPARYLTNALGVGVVLVIRKQHADLLQFVPIPFRRLLVRRLR